MNAMSITCFLCGPSSQHVSVGTVSLAARWSKLPLRILMMVVVACFGWDLSLGLAGQSPIYITFDLHVDPVSNGFPLSGKQNTYQERTGNMAWVLDQTETLDIPMSFLSSGWYMEMLVDEGPSGDGAKVLRRLYHTGAQIGSHNHAEHRVGVFDWPSFSGTPNLIESRKTWQDNIYWVNQGIATAFWGNPPKPVSEINNIKGSHLPKTEADYHTLMEEFGIGVREPGPEEDYYGYYGHHIWNPYRPAVDNAMAEDLSASFVQVVSGPVIGIAGIHHGILQDMTAASIKQQFLQLYINRRYADRTGAPEKVWTWGWGGHAHDFSSGSDSRTDLVDVLDWLENNFRDRVEPNGSQAMEYKTHMQTAEIYETWEVANPGVSSFSFDSLSVDWDEYPYLVPVAVAMKDYLWEADLDLADDVEAYQLEKSGDDAVVAWNDVATSEVDLSDVFLTNVGVLGLETGSVYGLSVDAANVLVAQEPLFIAAEIPGLSMGSGPSILEIAGNYYQGPTATLAIEITGTDAGEGGYHQLDVAGTASLDGALDIQTAASFVPQVGASVGTIGDQFVIVRASNVTGTFSTVTGNHVGSGKFYLPMYNATDVTLGAFQALTGDADGDQDIDITDFNTLATNFDPNGDHFSTNNWETADFDLDADVDITDFNFLASNFSPIGYVSQADLVPEPAAGLMFLAGCVAICLWQRSQAK